MLFIRLNLYTHQLTKQVLYKDFSLEYFGLNKTKKIPDKYAYTKIYFERRKEFMVLSNKYYEKFTSEPKNEYGWKFSISLEDRIENNACANLSKAWDLIIPIFFKNKITRMKIWCMGNSMSECLSSISGENGKEKILKGVEAGKQITIYASMNQEINIDGWNKIFLNITKEFIKAGIVPSCRPIGSFPLGNNPYISYRNDSTPKGGYQRPTVSRSGHPIPVDNNPYADMRFDFNEAHPKIPSLASVIGENEEKEILLFAKNNVEIQTNSPSIVNRTTKDHSSSEDEGSSNDKSSSEDKKALQIKNTPVKVGSSVFSRLKVPTKNVEDKLDYSGSPRK